VFRSRLIGVYEDILDRAQSIVKDRESDQLSIFGMLEKPEKIEVKYPNFPEYAQKEKLVYEKNVLGVYVSGHPLEEYKDQLKRYSFSTLLLLSKEEDEDGNVTYTDVTDGMQVTMFGILTGVKKVATKSGQFMSVLSVEDLYGGVECVMFPKVHEKYRNKIEKDNIVELKGKLQLRDGREPSIMVEEITPLVEKSEVKVEETEVLKKECLGLNIPSTIDFATIEEELIETLSAYPGDMDVFIKNSMGKFKSNLQVRKCNGLISELSSILSQENIVFFEK
jgi:DNA polymerase-3 subunit alpha